MPYDFGSQLLIPLTHGKFATVDWGDRHLIAGVKWHAKKVIRKCRVAWYARSQRRDEGTRIRLSMHRIIAGLSGGEKVDHADGDGLNNRRQNLRAATVSQNNANSRHLTGRSGYRGVDAHKNGSFTARIGHQTRSLFIGRFMTAVHAAAAYDYAAMELFGQFAFLNFDNDSRPSLQDVENHRVHSHAQQCKPGGRFGELIDSLAPGGRLAIPLGDISDKSRHAAQKAIRRSASSRGVKIVIQKSRDGRTLYLEKAVS